MENDALKGALFLAGILVASLTLALLANAAGLI